MYLCIAAVISAVIVIFTVLYKKRKISLSAAGSYLCLSFLLLFLAAASSLAAAAAGGGADGFFDAVIHMSRRVDDISAGNVNLNKILDILLSLVIPLPGAAAAVVCFVFMAKNSISDIKGCFSMSFVLAVFGWVSLLGALFFGCTAVLYAVGSAAVGLLALIAFSCFFAMITLGFGLLILIAAVPIYILFTGFSIAADCAGYAAASLLWCCAFLIFNICSGSAAAAVFIRHYRQGRISTKKALLYSALSFIPAVNIFASKHFQNAKSTE